MYGYNRAIAEESGWGEQLQNRSQNNSIERQNICQSQFLYLNDDEGKYSILDLNHPNCNANHTAARIFRFPIVLA